MENALTTLLVLFFAFLLLATGIEVAVDFIRSILEFFRVPRILPSLQTRVSLDEALKLADELAPDNDKLRAKAAAMKTYAQSLKNLDASVAERISNAEKSLAELKKSGLVPEDLDGVLAREYMAIVNAAKVTDRHRVYILRVLSAFVGVFLASSLDYNAFAMIADMKIINIPCLLKGGEGSFVTGLAASAGSSFWHDQLGKVRAAKQAVQTAKNVIKK